MGMGDVKVAESRGYERAHRQILGACKKAFESPANRANCSGFVKTVARELGIVAIGNLGKGHDIQPDRQASRRDLRMASHPEIYVNDDVILGGRAVKVSLRVLSRLEERKY
jgi:hypothetical protein